MAGAEADETIKLAADVNGDKAVDVADIGEVIDIMAALARRLSELANLEE